MATQSVLETPTCALQPQSLGDMHLNEYHEHVCITDQSIYLIGINKLNKYLK